MDQGECWWVNVMWWYWWLNLWPQWFRGAVVGVAVRGGGWYSRHVHGPRGGGEVQSCAGDLRRHTSHRWWGCRWLPQTKFEHVSQIMQMVMYSTSMNHWPQTAIHHTGLDSVQYCADWLHVWLLCPRWCVLCFVMVSVQPHSVERVAEAASGAVLTATTDKGPQQAPYTITVSDFNFSPYLPPAPSLPASHFMCNITHDTVACRGPWVSQVLDCWAGGNLHKPIISLQPYIVHQCYTNADHKLNTELCIKMWFLVSLIYIYIYIYIYILYKIYIALAMLGRLT